MLPQKIHQISKKEANQDGENDKKKKKKKKKKRSCAE